MVQTGGKKEKKDKKPLAEYENGGGGNKSFYGQTRALFVFVLTTDPTTSITARPFSSVILGL